MAEKRLFIAIPIPEDLKRKVLEVQKEMVCHLGSHGISWTRPEGIHLTLKFLGSVDEGRAGDIIGGMERVASRVAPFPIALSGAGAFPNERWARVIWMGVGESGPLFALQSAMEGEMERIGFPKEARSFNPHLTLGRVKDKGLMRRGGQTAATFRNCEIGELICDNMVLYESILRPDGARYVKIHRSCFSMEEKWPKR